jgi:predicted dehydrogenase
MDEQATGEQSKRETTPTSSDRNRRRRKSKKLRYAVVGLGHIAQNAVLPAFANARRQTELTALVSDDPAKLAELKRQYDVPLTYSYDQYDECLNSGEIDAVFIALPNHLHCEYTVRAAEAGVHVLCEKPMAVTADECRKMVHACETAGVRLMIAYRLHFDLANLKAVEIAQSGELGELRLFESLFTINVREGNIRLDREKGGGTLYDIGIYCINAARYLFQDEPIRVQAFSKSRGSDRFDDVDEMTAAVLEFPQQRLATFTSSFGVPEISTLRVVGTKGNLRMEPAYDYVDRLVHYLSVEGRHSKRVFAKRDQFAAELIYFANCVRDGRDPEPNGVEGLADVQIIEALYRSSETGRPVDLESIERRKRPTVDQAIYRPPSDKPELVNVEQPQLDA